MPRKATTKVRTVKRDTHGLIVDSNVNYIFNEDGFVDWRKMVKTEYLVPNKDRTSETDVTKLSDYDLLILLGGIKELAQIRGYTDVTYNVVSPHPEYVVATCSIKWIPNFETEGREVTFSAIGDAAPHNTHNFAKHFLGPIAENRAFVRCVRNFLKINIVSKEEMGNSKLAEAPVETSAASPVSTLQTVMREKGFSFDRIKNKLISEKFPEADSFESINDIPKPKMLELIGRIKSA
tara:strand:- start:23864 stop:24571 length:708 start_codon:yes stop_codon:yes gene_type:complete